MAVFSGSYRKALTSGTIAAGLTAASLVYAFRFGPTNPAQARIRRIIVAAGSVTGFAAGFINIEARLARPYTTLETAGGTAGVFTGIGGGRLDPLHPLTLGAACYMATTAAISGGTHVDETDPFANCALSVTATGGAPLVPAPFDLFRATKDEQPLVLNLGDGFSLKATVPGTGTWQLGVTVDWEEFA